ncbi:MAG: hypothetical protein U9N09_08250 [Euryarchaeota archaeon]|nr:hypothetical protein [Euryarchaeota archaeon]
MLKLWLFAGSGYAAGTVSIVRERCDFIDVSCYIPECDTGGGVDKRL